MIEWVWRCTCRSYSIKIGGVLGIGWSRHSCSGGRLDGKWDSIHLTTDDHGNVVRSVRSNFWDMTNDRQVMTDEGWEIHSEKLAGSGWQWILGKCNNQCMNWAVYAVLVMCSTQYLQYFVYPVLSVCSTLFMQYLVYAVLGLCTTWFMQYSVYAVLGLCSTEFMEYLVYAVFSGCSTRGTQYWVCAVLSICSI